MISQQNGSKRNRILIITFFLALAFIAPLVMAQQEENDATIVTYKLNWATANDADEIITNDLGYEITLDGGTVTTYSAELLTCAESSLTDWLLPQTTYAGHGDEISDARTTQPKTESLSQQTAVLLETRTIAASNYCDIQVVIGSNSDTPSLQITGSYLASNQDTAVSFSYQTDLAWGNISPLPTNIGTKETAVSITIQRNINQLFHGINFATDSEADIEKTLLRNLINSIEIKTDS